MITLQPSLNKLGILFLLLTSSAIAGTEICPKEFNVLERTKKDQYTFTPKTLESLHCGNKFEGEFFKIVNSISDEAISFNDKNPELVKRAANVYYHLTIARNHWIKKIKSDYVLALPQITVRIDITNAFSNVRHFKNAEQEKNFNNAWSIPDGETPNFVKDKIKWGKEIWFSPSKKLESRKLVKSDGNNPVHESLVLVKDPIVEYNKNAVIYQGLSLMVAPAINNSVVLQNSLKSLGFIAILYGAIEVSKHADHWFMDKYYFIDTAMVPEIIYHEYAHIAMSDTMKTVHSVPVIEGMADYFAADIAQKDMMYDKLKDFSSNKPKNLKNKSYYHPYLEAEWNSTSDFTVSLLWQGRLAFEKFNQERARKNQTPIANYDDLVFQAHYHLDENSDIANHLTSALINACKEKCEALRPGINLLNGVFERKGLN